MEYIRVLLDTICSTVLILMIFKNLFYFEIRDRKITGILLVLSPVFMVIIKWLFTGSIVFTFVSLLTPIVVGACCTKFRFAILYGIFIQSVIGTLEAIIESMISTGCDLAGVSYNYELSMTIVIALVCVFVMFFVLVVQGRYVTKQHRFSSRILICISIISGVGFSIYSVCKNILYDTEFYNYDAERVKLFLIFFSAALLIEIIVVCYLYFEKTHYSIAVDYAEEYFEMQKEYFLKIDELNNDIRRFRHDNQNHINILNSYAESNDFPAVKKYLSEISEQLPKSKVKIRTKDFIFNSLIEQKYGIMMNNGIEFNTDIQISELRKIEDFPFCTIFSNALQNAIEACLACPEGKRYINVKYHINDSVLILSVANSVSTKVIIKNNRIKTSKKDKKNHGIGLFQIKNAVEKLKGHCKLTCTDEEFVISVVLDNK